MTWETLAPWIAIAFTLALSILVPLFTQIANNSHQRKMQREKLEYEEKQKKKEAYEAFLVDVGAIITAAKFAGSDEYVKAGASLHRMYIYAPKEWHGGLSALSNFIYKFEWDNANYIMQDLSRLISEDQK